ncbi:hypothetical protein [Nonomuraea helvata]|uniref:Tyr recombinase domain-containing protein n=1 Tax=Nonomuraea helvata TaxID=37484 RepID=A0ABV5S3G2_9ACTN
MAEVVGLDLADVRLSARKGELRICGKGRDSGKIRHLPVHSDLRQALQDWLHARADWNGAGTTAVFLNHRGGRIGGRSAADRTHESREGCRAEAPDRWAMHMERPVHGDMQAGDGLAFRATGRAGNVYRRCDASVGWSATGSAHEHHTRSGGGSHAGGLLPVCRHSRCQGRHSELG